MQASPTLFTQNKKSMGFYMPPGDRRGEMISRIEEHGGQVNSKWGKDLIVLVPPDYYGKAPPGAEVYSYDYVLSSIRKNNLQPLESFRVQVPPSPAPAAKTRTKATAPATTAPATTATPKTTATSVSPSAAKGRRPYTKEEDEMIKSYVNGLGPGFSPTGTTIWLEMEKAKVIPGRTWQSLKDRYLKRILPVEEALGNLSAATSTTSSSSTSSSSTLAASKASPPRPSTSGSRRVSVAHDSSTPVRKELFGKANTLDVSEDDDEGEEEEAEEDGDEDEEDENAGEEVPDGLKKSPKQQPSSKSGAVTGTPTPTTTTTTTKRKASETPPSAAAKEKTASPVAPKGKRRKIQDDSQEVGEEEGANGKAPDSDAEEVEAGVVLKPSGQERTDHKRPGGRAQEVEHVVARLREETGQAESVVFHALAVASGDPALALLYLRGRQMWYEPWTPAEDKELQRSGARRGGRVAARPKADVHARCAFLGVH